MIVRINSAFNDNALINKDHKKIISLNLADSFVDTYASVAQFQYK